MYHVHVHVHVCVYMYITSIIIEILLMQTIGGVLEEFIFAPRIDNQLNCYAGLEVCNLLTFISFLWPGYRGISSLLRLLPFCRVC